MFFASGPLRKKRKVLEIFVVSPSPRRVVVRGITKRLISRTKTLRDDEKKKEIVMQQKAFTLIELLVVVLIIGILAAVAVPQYQKAVIRTRFAALKPMTHALAAAQERYYLANGSYAANIADLDINLPAGKDETKSTEDTYYYDWGYCGISSSLIRCGNSSTNMQYQVFLQYTEGGTKAPNKRCIVFDSQDLTDMRNQVCKAEAAGAAGQKINSGNYTRWTFQ